MSASTEETQEERVCNQCNKVGTTFQRCGRCKLVHYCSRDCQAKVNFIHQNLIFH